MKTEKKVKEKSMKKTKQKIDPKVGQVAEGKTLKFETDKAINSDELKVFEFDGTTQEIKIETKEFSAVCPFSGLPDIATLIIEYTPTEGLAIELKALKYYLMSFRNVGIYQEGVTKRIIDDLTAVLKTKNVKVTTIYNTRGGMDVTCVETGHDYLAF
jgi:7-cyano-7-deazaguanine reductase